MVYLFSGIYIEFDYKQNVKSNNAVILSKEFGSYKYSKEIDSVNWNIPLSKLFDRLIIDSIEIKELSVCKITFNGTELSLLDFLKLYSDKYSGIDLVLYLDAKNYALIISWFFKTFFPNMTVQAAFNLYHHILVSQFALQYLDNQSYIFDLESFTLLYDSIDPTTDSIVSEWVKSINIAFKFSTICTTYTLDQIEDIKNTLIKNVIKFYQRSAEKTYRKLIENYHYFEKSGLLYKEGNDIVWQMTDTKQIRNLNDITYDLISYVFSRPEDATQFSLDLAESETVGEYYSFTKILSLKKAVYDRITDPAYKGVLKVDPMLFFFLNQDIEKFNPSLFIKFTADFNFNSDFFSSSSFAGNLMFVADYIGQLIKTSNSEINCFCLNKII